MNFNDNRQAIAKGGDLQWKFVWLVANGSLTSSKFWSKLSDRLLEAEKTFDSGIVLAKNDASSQRFPDPWMIWNKSIQMPT